MMYCYGHPDMAKQKQDDQNEHTFSNYVRIRDVVQKTYHRRWTIGKSGERGSGISVLPARHDDDDDIIIRLDQIIIKVPEIGIMVRAFAKGPGNLGSIPSRVTLKTQKMVFDATLLITQHYKVRIKSKVEQSRERSSTLPSTLVW